jgi:hypothetical protein
LEVQRGQLRNEENYQYHRLTSSYLSESVISFFQQQSKGIVEEPKQEIKEEEQKSNIIKQNQDDIFVEGGDDYYDMPEENNLLDDLLNGPIVPLLQFRSKRRRKTWRGRKSILSISPATSRPSTWRIRRRSMKSPRFPSRARSLSSASTKT